MSAYGALANCLRHIEGAASVCRKDTMRFASTLENMGVRFYQCHYDAHSLSAGVVTLSAHVPDLPIVGHIPCGGTVIAI